MARINDRLLLQRVEDRLVIIDDATGAEVPFPVGDGARLTAMAAYLTDPADPDRVWREARGELVAVGAVPLVGDSPLERMVQELEAENTRLQAELAEAEARVMERPKPRSLEYPASEFEGLTEQKIASEYAFAVAAGSVNSFEAERKRVLAWAAHIRAEAAEAALAGDVQ